MIRRMGAAGCAALSIALFAGGVPSARAADTETPPAASATVAQPASPTSGGGLAVTPASPAAQPSTTAPAAAAAPSATQPPAAPSDSAATGASPSDTAAQPAPAPAASDAPAPAAGATVPAAPASNSAPEPAPAVAPVQTVAARLAPAVRQAVDALLKSELPRGMATIARREREALSGFYAARSDAPLWIDGEGHWTAAAQGALARLQHASEDALDLKIAALPVLADGGDDASRAATDVALSMAVVTYGKEASDGRVDPHVISPLIDDKKENFTPAQILTRVSEAADADSALRGFNPPQPGYVALRDKLAELRAGKTAQVTPIAQGHLLRIGMRDERVPLLRERFGLADGGPDARLYDRQVADAVATFQREHHLRATGHLDSRTVAALSGGRTTRLEDDIIANMELWRWMPRDYGTDRVEVNIPDFALKVVENGEVVHRARVIVGKKDTPTPIFSNAIQFIIVNPYWNVPQSIIKKEMLPKLAQDPAYFQQMGYEAFYRKGRLVVRQPPGERNALGRIKFMFPNDHAVYLHDTPSRSLFSARNRAFSHGCVRVQEPLALAETVLGKKNGWSQARFKKLIGGPERTVRLPKALPIHIEYFTAYVDETGHLQLRDDVYGYSQKLKSALGLAG